MLSATMVRTTEYAQYKRSIIVIIPNREEKSTHKDMRRILVDGKESNANSRVADWSLNKCRVVR